MTSELWTADIGISRRIDWTWTVRLRRAGRTNSCCFPTDG